LERNTENWSEVRYGICSCKFVQEISGWIAGRKKNAIKKATEHGISIRQLSRLTDISKAVIEKYLKQ